MTLTLFDDTFEMQDRLSYARNMLAYNPFCRHLAWDYVRVTGFQYLQVSGSSGASAVINSFSGLLSTRAYLADAETFLSRMEEKGWVTEKQLEDALISISINVDIGELNHNWSEQK